MAEVMLAFITWLTRQEFGRKCVVSIRDILSWVNFMNSMAEDAAVKRPEGIENRPDAPMHARAGPATTAPFKASSATCPSMNAHAMRVAEALQEAERPLRARPPT